MNQDTSVVERLMHYAAKPVGLVREWKYEQREPHSFGKPEGFWVSVQGEDDWPSWCQHEEFDLGRLGYAHHVRLSSDANILRITSALELDEFTVKYAVQTEFERRFTWKRDDKRKWPIDWRGVAAQLDGIIIAPYQWGQRNATDWYYGWDCASGCIWNTAAIASVEPVAAEVSA